jgi:hypothetical protein
MEQHTTACFAICLNNQGYEDDLKVRTVYEVLPDESAARSQYVRIIDETGEDYLYPSSYFVFIDVPQEVETTLRSPNRSIKTGKKRKTGGNVTRRKAKVIA